MDMPERHAGLRLLLAVAACPSIVLWIWLAASIPGTGGWGRGFVEAFLVLLTPAALGGLALIVSALALLRRPRLAAVLATIGLAVNVVTVAAAAAAFVEHLGRCVIDGGPCPSVLWLAAVVYIAGAIAMIPWLWRIRARLGARPGAGAGPAGA